MSKISIAIATFALGAAVLGGGCGKSKREEAGGTGRLSAAEIEAARTYKHPGAEEFYKANPEMFTFASPADLPTDLSWKDGHEQPDLGSPEAVKGGTINMWLQDFPRTLRYQGPDANGSFRRFIHDDNNLHLVDRHPGTGDYFAMLAESWAIGADKRTIYFKLDRSATYSDGVPIIADDYFFTIYFMRSEWIRGPWYNNFYSTKYTNITKFDDHTISVTLAEAKPDPLMFFEEDLLPKPRHFYKEFGEDYVERYQWKLEPTTGAYTIGTGDINKGRSLVQTRLKDWWAKDKKFVRYRFNPDKRRFTVMRDVNKHDQAFIKGDYDMLRIRDPAQWYDKLDPAKVPDVANGYIVRAQFYNQIPRPTYALYINRTKPLLDNLDVRVGLQHASNWQKVIDQYFRGDYQRMRTASDGYDRFTHPTLQPREYSVEKAGEAFARAGFTRRGSDGILENADGTRLSFTLTTGYQRLADPLTILEQEARKAGVELKLEILDSTAGWKKVQEKKHEIMLTALNVSVEPYPRYHDNYHSYNAFDEDGSLKANTNNFTVTSDPSYDALIERYDRSQDLDEIMELAHELEEKIYADAAFVPGYVRPFFKFAYWRWIRWPDSFNVRKATEHDEYHLYWIDEELKKETLAAKKKGESFGETTRVFDQFKTD